MENTEESASPESFEVPAAWDVHCIGWWGFLVHTIERGAGNDLLGRELIVRTSSKGALDHADVLILS